MQSKSLWSMVVAVGIVLVLGAHAEAQMAKQGTYAGNFGWYAIGKTFELEKEHAQSQDKITERAAKYGLRLQDMENFAFSIMAATDGWLSLQETKDQIEHTLTDLIINAHPEQR